MLLQLLKQKFNRNDSEASLEESISKCDFIIHLAGEVRPNSSDDEFKNSNILLTSLILEILKKQNKIVPILLTSTIHAKLLKNEYGKTKRESEILLEDYAKNNNTNCFIYRLPHVFGEECKPNYNSVVSTWIYNSLNDLEINVFDRNIEMHYVYVQDIVDEFLSILEKKEFFDKDRVSDTWKDYLMMLYYEKSKINIHKYFEELICDYYETNSYLINVYMKF